MISSTSELVLHCVMHLLNFSNCLEPEILWRRDSFSGFFFGGMMVWEVDRNFLEFLETKKLRKCFNWFGGNDWRQTLRKPAIARQMCVQQKIKHSQKNTRVSFFFWLHITASSISSPVFFGFFELFDVTSNAPKSEPSSTNNFHPPAMNNSHNARSSNTHMHPIFMMCPNEY